MMFALRLVLLGALAIGVAGCPGGGGGAGISAHMKAIPAEAQARMAALGMKESAPIFIRIFKEDSELEVWKETSDGFYELFKTYPICKWSGELGPKLAQGDAQSPEGFYTVTPGQMNPKSQYHLAFNLGYPNNFDRAHGRTGSALMVHGDCKSIGCYAMTDALVEEIYAIAREAFSGGQREFPVHAFPFRMSDLNMTRHKDSKWMPFWRTLKEGYEAFEIERRPPTIAVCSRQYLVNASFLGFEGRPDPAAACPAYAKRKPDLIASVLRNKVLQTGAAPVTTAALAPPRSTPPAAVAAPVALALAHGTAAASPASPAPAPAPSFAAASTLPAAPPPAAPLARVAPPAATPPAVRVRALVPTQPAPAPQLATAPVVLPPANAAATAAAAAPEPAPAQAASTQPGLHGVRKTGKGDMLAPPAPGGQTGIDPALLQSGQRVIVR